MTLATQPTPPPIYFATRRSSHDLTKQPSFRVVAVIHSDEPLSWATHDHALTTYSEAAQAYQPKRLVASASLTPAPYTRSIDITIESDDFPHSPFDLDIIAASENIVDVETSMQDDVARFVKQAEEKGWAVRTSWSDSRAGQYCSSKCRATAVVQHSGHTTWWDFWMQPVSMQVVVKTGRDGVRVPTEQEEKERTVLGEALLSKIRYVEDGTEEGKLSWADMGLERVVDRE